MMLPLMYADLPTFTRENKVLFLILAPYINYTFYLFNDAARTNYDIWSNFSPFMNLGCLVDQYSSGVFLSLASELVILEISLLSEKIVFWLSNIVPEVLLLQ